MDLKRIVTFGVAGGALVAWLASAATSGGRVAAPRGPRPAAIEERGSALAADVARLHERLRPDAAPRRPSRNLFQFAEAPRPSPPPAPSTPVFQLAPPPAAPPAPVFKLSGLAEDPGPNGPVRTAILSGLGQVFLAREGETVTLRYRVTKIGADAVELVDTRDGSVIRLGIR